MTSRPDDTTPPIRITWQAVLGFSERSTPGWDRVRTAQQDELVRQLPLVSAAHCGATLLLTWMCRNSVPPLPLATWAVLSLLVSALGIFAAGQAKPAGPRVWSIPHSIVFSGLFGLIWALPPTLFSGGAPLVEQLAMAMAPAAMMGLVALTCGPLPVVAAVFALVTGAGLTAMAAGTGSIGLALLPLAYATLLIMGGASAARALIARRWAELALEEQSEVVRLLLRESEGQDADWLWEVDSAKLLRRVSGRLARAAGLPAAEIEGCSLIRLLAGAGWETGETAPEIAELVERLNARERVSNFEVPVTLNGEERWWSLSAAPRLDERGGFAGFRGVGSDVTERRRSTDRIEHAARFDALTGLCNRAHFMNEARKAIAAAHRDGDRAALLLIDLDKFKPVNDTLGHPVGDKLLKRVAERTRGRIGPNDLAGRLGGDEFAVLVRSHADDPRVAALATELIAVLVEPFEVDGQLIRIGASIGSALALRDGRTLETIVRNADLALYRAKHDGRGCHRRFIPALLADSERRRAIESALREALETDQFTLLYQPMIEGDGGRIVGFEALIRWTHPTLGEIAPVDFLKVAEEAQLAARLGAWVLRSACVEAAHWPQPLRVAVNLSSEQLADRQLPAIVVAALAGSGLAAQRLELDVSEQSFLRDNGTVVTVLDQLRSLGVRIALDDFGSGYAALGYVRRGRFDTIKIDQAFVRGAAQSEPESLAIVRSVVALAGSLGISTVAEGMETDVEYRRMRDLGCRHMQGHYAGAPMPADAVRQLVDAPEPMVAAR
ncbi:putative bifunctional diguanylate cyclase/phosphodiesterase [Sphingomonas jatrophae]|uniref:PAS domain S-box-containing protein/diguanylate cyclase (GGDEF) domain-containing protein n=1 Tax=Sphingomonas jatrophae TaxID=1166337 RepID=A0A1I6LAD2_9SPHN|nr:EAL domain-containing protein [Sphingomonas jatrophae]SFS00389.1 PAS domain S-box-containing protein/diguanylate cyclase (GGDEF) domain-containing protein [Sphingomonas jatrophae]